MRGSAERDQEGPTVSETRPVDADTMGQNTGEEPVKWPSVTAVIPTLGDRADLLEQTIGAILGQDYPGTVECLVVFDKRSADAQPGGDPERWERTRQVASAAGAKVLENDRSPGLAGSRNTGILAASGDLVANCDDDDYWRPGKLRAQVTALMAEPGAATVCCGITLEYGDKLITRVHPAEVVVLRDLLRSRLMELHVSSFVSRRATLLDAVGLVSEEIPGSRSEDYEFLLRAARFGPLLNVPQPGVVVRWHTQRKAMYGRWPLVAKALPWMLDRYPEFATVPAGYARVAGQAAFAFAACGDTGTALKWIGKTLRANPREPRAYLALGVAAKVVRPDAVIRTLHRFGRGL
jgi:glycosyltransferase involved in cell wall biosynthesis